MEMGMEIEMEIEIRKGVPALWEKGGGINAFLGFSTIIADCDGLPKKPLKVVFFAKKYGNHALFEIKKGDVIVQCRYNNANLHFEIYKVKSIDLKNKCAKLKELAHLYGKSYYFPYSQEFNIPENCKNYKDAIFASEKKVSTYHCRKACYYKK